MATKECIEKQMEILETCHREQIKRDKAELEKMIDSILPYRIEKCKESLDRLNDLYPDI